MILEYFGILKKLELNEIRLKFLNRRLMKLYEKRKFTKQFTFENRSNNSCNLLLVLAGFQEFYWDVVLERVNQNQRQFSESIDICICVPLGENTEKLRDISKNNNWSFLQIDKDLLAQVQNIAIMNHPKAEWIFKIDEDIIISDNYFEKMKYAYNSFYKESHMKIGFCAPLININAYGARLFLNTMDLNKEYEKLFGKYEIMDSWAESKIHKDVDVAEWIWGKSIPFDEVALKVEKNNWHQTSVCPHRFSIGAILIKRTYWKKIGAFIVGIKGEMGLEEQKLCEFCMNDMHAIVIAEDTFVGHLGFYTQKEAVHRFFENNINSIKRKQ